MRILSITFILFSTAIFAQNPAMEICPISIGSKPPLANIYSLSGDTVSLYELVKTPTVLVFYRGGWCPYCKRHLAAIQESESRIKELGYQVIALSADHYTTAPKVVDKKDLNYTVYSDFEQQAAKAFGISFVLDEKTYSRYKNVLQLDIENWGRNDRHELPVPAIFVIKDDRIQFSYTNPDYKTRLSPNVLVAFLEDLENTEKPTSSAAPKALAGDVNSPEAIVAACLNAVSHEKGKTVDVGRLRSLFLPTAQISMLQHPTDSTAFSVFSLKEFISILSKPSAENSFKEYSTGNTTESYNGLATVFQSYVSLHNETQVKGVNTYQLVYIEDRWWIASLIWTNDKNGIEVPEKYIKK